MQTDAREHLYGHLGIDVRSTGEMTAEGDMPIGAHLLTPGGARAAPLALLIEGSFGGNILAAGLFPVLDNMTVHMCQPVVGTDRVRSHGELVRRSSQRAVARGWLEDAGDPSRMFGYATIAYRMIQPQGDYMPGGNESVRTSNDGARTPSTEPILDAMGMRVRPGEPVCELDAVHQGVMAPEGRLHGGAHQLMHEAAALAAATGALGTDRVRVGDFSIRFMAPAMTGPFVATASVLSSRGDEAHCQVELVDEGAGDRLTSLSTLRLCCDPEER